MLLLRLVPLLLLVLPVRAQLSGDQWKAYTSMRQINRVLIHQGAVWAGTSGGVLRYDHQTQSYTRFTRRDGLPGNIILSLSVDANGHLWFGTHSEGLSRYRPEKNDFDPPFLDFQNLRINALEPHGDILYVGSERGVSAFVISKEEVKETYRRLGNLPKDTEVTSIAMFAGRLWAGTGNGLVWADLDQPNLQDPSSWKSESIRGKVRDMLVYQDTLFVSATDGLWRVHPALDHPELDYSTTSSVALGLFDGRIVSATADGLLFQRQGIDHWQPLRAPHIRSTTDLSDTEGPLWVASTSGLRVLGADQPPPPREPVGNFFFDITQTDDDHLWVASVPKDNLPAFGLYEFDGEGWTTHTSRTNLSTEKVSAVETDAEGLLWVGTWGAGIDVRDANGRWHRLTATNSALEGIAGDTFVAISDIDRDANGLMWIANVRNGLVVMDGWPPQQAVLNNQLDFGMSPDRDKSKIAIGPDGLKWVGTALDGFLLFDDGGTPFELGDEIGLVFDTVAYPNRLTSDTVIDIHVDHSGRVWVATNNGLNAVRGEYSRTNADFAVTSWKVYNTDNGLPANATTALAEDDWGRIWVGTEDGLARIDTEGEVEFTLDTSDGLVNNRVNSLYFDRENDALWIGTLAGMSRLQLGTSGTAAGPQAYAYPNPFLLGVRGASLTFADLPLGAGVRIFTAAGELVRQLDGAAGEGAVTWNGQSAAGFLVGSGIYYFVAQAETGDVVRGKFAVINNR